MSCSTSGVHSRDFSSACAVTWTLSRIRLFTYLSYLLVTVRVCRWVKWTSMVECCRHSMTSGNPATCWTAKVTCWSLTLAVIVFYCWAVNYNYNASSLTQTLKSSCGGHGVCTTTSSRHNCTLYTAPTKTSSRCSLSA